MDIVSGPERKRGGCLTIWLIVVMVLNPLVAIYYLYASTLGDTTLVGFPAWFIPLMIVLSIVNFACGFALWNWKKWGLYGFIGTSVIAFIANVMTIGFLSSLSGLVGIAILYALVRPVWKYLE